ncbi:hypothetical protein [Nocardia sp. alder85J]|uniref:hypothetical protein n=1 Tax=Nocardia sp. alder85J TaxID=2862949 RepID=UPI001CD1E761|nr:hypothetical protein [Nocardia sp. alder85J]MCX4098224.1 hypothetical protein [Nocardia sp. alder85J]
MMILVRLIDILVTGVKILGGRTNVNPVLRYGLWLAVLSTVAAGLVVAGGLLVLLQHYLVVNT